jgi:hypothetical protein
MPHKPEIDRSKHDVDVLEQVFRGVHTEAAEPTSVPHVVDLSISPWVAGDVISAVQVEVLPDDDDGNG